MLQQAGQDDNDSRHYHNGMLQVRVNSDRPEESTRQNVAVEVGELNVENESPDLFASFSSVPRLFLARHLLV